MRKQLVLLLCILLALAGTAGANVSRIYSDGFFSGSIRPVGPSDALVLTGEHLDVAFPVLESDLPSLKRKAMVTARYTVSNRSPAPVRVPLQFLALDLADPRVTVNGTPVPAGLVEDRAAGSEFLEKLTRHRYQWEPKLYEQYFQYLDAVNRGEGSTRSSSMIGLDLQGFVAAAKKTQDPARLFPQARHFSALRFTAVFMPGRNVLEVGYGQGLYVEGRTAYSGGPAAHVAFDYLLYPALSWSLDPGFEMTISVRLPDMVRRGWLWDSRETASHRTNLTMAASHDGAARVTTLSARYATIPAEIFSFVIGTRPE